MATRLTRDVLIAISAVIAFTVGATVWLTWIAEAILGIDTYLAGDFTTYWSGARRLLSGVDLYSHAQLAGPYFLPDMDYGAGYIYPPTAAALSSPIGFLPVTVAWALFAAVGLVGLSVVVYHMARREHASRVVAILVTVLVLTSGPVAQGVLAGNVNLWVAVGFGCIWLRPSAGLALATLGTLVKLFPGVAGLWSIRTKEWSWRPIAAGMLVVAATIAWVGLEPWRDFQVAFANSRPFAADVPQSPRMLLEPVLGAAGATVAGYAFAVVFGGVSLAVRSNRVAFFMLSLAMITPAAEWHLHYLLIPLVGLVPILSATLGKMERSTTFIRRRHAVAVATP